ncbi:unnamed protein product [Rangifer tarandus platyrhynchus]|uniref:Uncharacterized protein n=1 Tax=Rangifer tarandus platyrhynchus TaxID=3082113 RepID=A0ABN8Y5C3_RANTA|nr:unnamed protein product [Rangifer tarandus platyrhynchus]
MLPVQVFLQLHELQRGTPSRMGSCLTIGNELSEEIHVLTKQKTLLERRAGMENNATIDIKSDYQDKMSMEFYFKKERRLILRELSN